MVETGHGIGHITRSLNLAETFESNHNVEMFFLTRGKKGIEKIKYPKSSVPSDTSFQKITQEVEGINPDIFIMDILDLNSKIIERLKERGVLTVVVFDFLTDKKIPADIIVNQNINMLNYKNDSSKCLLGPKYAILEQCFRESEKKIKEDVDSIMISMGGSDPKSYTEKAIKALTWFEGEVDVILGPLTKNKEKVGKITSQYKKFELKLDIKHEKMCKLMLDNDILLSTAGNTMYEAASLGLPNIVFCNHEKHRRIAKSFQEREIIVNLGISPETKKIKKAVNELTNNLERRKEMGELGRKLVDSKGVDRVVDVILKEWKRRDNS